MINTFKNISLSYKQAPLDIRSKFTLDEIQCKRFIELLKERTSATDILILSTCNRTELYYSSEIDLTSVFYTLLALVKGVEITDEDKTFFTKPLSGNDAVNHLYRVSLGLEAQVVGDLQISNQVKRAYQLSADLEVAGPFLHRVLHSTFYSNKRVVQETSFRDGAASVSYATVELVEELSSVLMNPKVLILGAGEMGEDIAKNLFETSLDHITIANRTLEKAELLATSLGFFVTTIDEALANLSKYDVIVSTIPGDKFQLELKHIEGIEILSYKYFVDVSVPASIHTDIESQNGAILYNIDQINTRTEEALNKRLASIPKVETIIEEAIVDLKDWEKEMEVSPTIQKLKNTLDQIRQEEINRFVKDYSTSEVEKIDLVTKNIMQKIIKLPVLQLKAACKRGEAETLIDVLNDLFNLEEEKVK